MCPRRAANVVMEEEQEPSCKKETAPPKNKGVSSKPKQKGHEASLSLSPFSFLVFRNSNR